MIAELLTPLMLATAPQAVDGLASTYSHNTQSVDGWAGSSKDRIAYSSTRTYDMWGKPNDSDFD